jgi:hypothetical protein
VLKIGNQIVTNWYKNFLANQILKISVGGEEEIPARCKSITE